MIINHNINAMNAHRQLGVNNANAGKSMEKLSSGLRINRAGDDAAGLAISEKMRGQIRGLDQASRNAQDGISLIQTAEGALSETHSILQRMRELAVQASNDTNVSADRTAIQDELNQLTKEIDRIATTTEFNTQNLLNGSFSSKEFQIGANEKQKLTLSINKMDTASLGLTSSITMSSGSTISAKLADGTYKVSGNNVYDSSSNVVGKVSANKIFTGGTSVLAAGNDDVLETGSYITISESGSKFSIKGAVAGNAKSMSPGTYEIKAGGNILKDNSIVGRVSGGKLFINQADGSKLSVANTNLGISTAAITSGKSFTINGVDASTRDTAMGSITSINTAIETVSKERAKLGAYQNRLEHTIANLGTSAENLTAAESRVRDVDMAKEMMQFSKNNILAQAAQAMLAQANQQPQGVLQLLR
ncbi:flagellin N-terminal helical domain-containing protein [Clostridium prolinivorans]|uniref:flagellin N-terminal helical domain-containing protein n=1 Tax=Clostridium prolinivorans TaxID=2769420 RepID=UPI000FD71A52|nr:flagellin [Clostridium prolinivorans]